MSDPTARALALVTTPRTPQQSREAFALAVQAVMQAHADVGSEGYWQGMALVVARHWQGLASDQSPLETMAMISKCNDSVLKIRRLAQRAKGQSGADALAEFQDFMRDVLEIDDEA